MPIAYTIDGSRGIVFSTWTDEIGRDELIGYLTRLRKDSEFRSHFSQLADLSRASIGKLGFNDLMQVRDYDPFSSASRRAIFAPDDLAFGIARMYSALWGENFAVFRSVSDARTWLNA